MDDDPAGSSDCVATPFARPSADANGREAGWPAAIETLSAPVFRFGSCGVLHQPPFQTGGDAAVLCFRLLESVPYPPCSPD